MSMLILALLSFATFLLVEKLRKITKLENQILYLLLGILVGFILQKTKYATITNLFPDIKFYTTIALLFMFFIAGFSINVSQLKKSGPVTAKLFSIPAYTETLLISMLIFGLLQSLPWAGFDLVFAEALIAAAIFSGSSPANTVSICIDMISSGYTGKNNIPATMITASVIDSFITVPVIFLGLFLVLADETGKKVSFKGVLIILIITLVGILLSFGLGILLGKVELLLSGCLFKKISKENQSKFVDYFLILAAFFIALGFGFLLHSIDILQKVIALFSILIMCAIGASINFFDRSNAHEIIGREGNKLFGAFGMPAIFIYVGAIINIKALFDPILLIVLVILTFAAVLTKSKVAAFILRRDTYTKGERTFAALCYTPKGVGLINFSVIFGAILGTESALIAFMTMLATVSILITMPIGIAGLHKAKGTLIPKVAEKD